MRTAVTHPAQLQRRSLPNVYWDASGRSVPLLRDVAQVAARYRGSRCDTDWITVIQSVQRNAVTPLSSEWLTTLADALAVVFVAWTGACQPDNAVLGNDVQRCRHAVVP